MRQLTGICGLLEKENKLKQAQSATECTWDWPSGRLLIGWFEGEKKSWMQQGRGLSATPLLRPPVD
jgi:hypothetical protein